MFSLFSGCYEYMTRKEEFHILVVGLDKAGKTTLLERLKTLYTDFPGLDPAQIVPTVGLNIGRIEAAATPMVFWDLGGQAGLRSIWDKYYAESHAVIFVVDAADVRRIEEAKQVLDRMLGEPTLSLFACPSPLGPAQQQLVGCSDADTRCAWRCRHAGPACGTAAGAGKQARRARGHRGSGGQGKAGAGAVRQPTVRRAAVQRSEWRRVEEGDRVAGALDQEEPAVGGGAAKVACP